jgi:hypothetical protein
MEGMNFCTVRESRKRFTGAGSWFGRKFVLISRLLPVFHASVRVAVPGGIIAKLMVSGIAGDSGSMTMRRLVLGSFIASILCVRIASAAFLLPGGDFESGSFFGWQQTGINSGYSLVTAEGTCYSDNDTTGITLNGDYSALIRSNPLGDPASSASITSEPFLVGSSVSFVALSEVAFGQSSVEPVTLTVSLVATDGVELMSMVIVQTNTVTLNSGCPNLPRNGSFHGHLMDTTLFQGSEARVRFTQHTNRSGYGLFTLIDDVTVYEAGEVPVLIGPTAVAGTSIVDNALALNGSRSYHPLGVAVRYEWFIDDQAGGRTGEFVNISDLEPGNYSVVLFTNDGYSYTSDILELGIIDPDADVVECIDDPFTEEDECAICVDDPDTEEDECDANICVDDPDTEVDECNCVDDPDTLMDECPESGEDEESDGTGSSVNFDRITDGELPDQGPSDDFEAGFEEGFEEGFGEGFDEGFNEGVDEGFNDGFDQGFDEGFDKGFDLGSATDPDPAPDPDPDPDPDP